jgi:hypothetical protein
MRRARSVAVGLGVLLFASGAHAQDAKQDPPPAGVAPQPAPPQPAATEPANPDKLFAEAMTLVAEEHYAEAIPKLEEAQRLDPGIGTQFNLAICYAKTGRLALAWRNFRQVELLAGAAGKKERATAARAQLEELRQRVAHVSLRVAVPSAVTVRIDGDVVLAEDLAFVPLDPGEHKIEVTAAARRPFEDTVTISAEGEGYEVLVPTLAPLEKTQTEIRTVMEETTNTRRTLGYVFGGVGLVGVATATVTGIMILSDKSTADDRCKPDCVTPTGEVDSEGADAVQRGKTLLPINVVAWVVAAVGLGAGGFFLLTSGKQTKAARTTVVPYVDARGGYSVLTTTF